MEREKEGNFQWVSAHRKIRVFATCVVGLLLAAPAFAQAGNSPWENAVNVLQTAFTSTIARGLSLVAIVVAGLTFAFGEGGSKRGLAGLLFGHPGSELPVLAFSRHLKHRRPAGRSIWGRPQHNRAT